MAEAEKGAMNTDPSPAPVASVARRFLGTRLEGNSVHDVTARLLFSASLLFVCLVTLIAILMSFQDQLGDRLLMTAYTSVPDHSGLPPLSFVRQDRDQLRQTPGFLMSTADDSPPLENVSTGADFERLLTTGLLAVEHQTLILAVRCHSVSTSDGVFLQPTDGDPSQPESGVALDRLLAALARCPSQNKLLLLDIAPLPSDLDLALPGNEAATQLTAAFKLLKETPNGIIGSFWILAANAEGQPSGSLFACQSSAFSLFTAYGLNGGPEVEGSGSADGIITASELTTFVEQRVADWSLLRRNQLQRPFLLSWGPDFPVSGVQEFSSMSKWLASHSPLASAEFPESKDAEKNAKADAAKDSPPTGTDGKSPAPPAPPAVTVRSLVEQLSGLWQIRQQLKDTQIANRRPWHWMLLAQHLQRAERFLLAGELETAQRILVNDALPLQKDLTEQPVETIHFPWTSAFDDIVVTDNELKKPLSEFLLAFQEPSPRNLAALAESPIAEASLLLRLSSVFATNEGTWTEPKRVATAVEIRRISENAGRLGTAAPASAAQPAVTPRLSRPWLLPFVRPLIENADAERNAAEQALLVGRLEMADQRFEHARTLYQQAQSECQRLDGQLHEVHMVAMDCVCIMRWLGAISMKSQYQNRLVRLNGVMRGIIHLRQNPKAELLPPLLNMIHEFRRLIVNDVRETLLSGRPEEISAALHLPFLDPTIRSEMLLRLANVDDRPRSGDSLQQFGETSDSVLACPYSLGLLYESMGVPNRAPDRDSQFDPEQRDAPLLQNLNAALQDLNADDRSNPNPETLRDRRNLLAGKLRSVLNELQADPLAMPPAAKSGAWEQYLNHLVRASFQAEQLSRTRFQPVVTNAFLDRLTAEQLIWQLDRLRRDSVAVGVDYAGGARRQMVRSLQQVDPMFLDTLTADAAAFTARQTAIHLSHGGELLDVQFRISSSGVLQKSDRTQLVIDWYAQRDKFRVTSVVDPDSGRKSMASIQSDSAKVGDNTPAGSFPADRWQLRLPISGHVWDDGAKIDVQLQSLRGEITSSLQAEFGPLTAWIELDDDSQWPLPLQYQVSAGQPLPFELQLTRGDGIEVGEQINLLPNEVLSLKIGVLSRLQESREITLEIESGTGLVQWPFSIPPGPNPVPVTPPANAAFEIVDGHVELRILDGAAVVHRRNVTVNIQNPVTCFDPSVTFDPADLKLTVHARRLKDSDATMAQTMDVSIRGAEVTEGKLNSAFDPATHEAVADATVADNPQSRNFTAVIGVAGVPRLFTFDVNRVTGEVRRSGPIRVDVTAPEEGAVFPVTSDPQTLDVQLQIDCPRKCEVHIGLDRNGDEYLDSAERITGGRFWSGRIVRTRFAATAEPAEFSLSSTVSDITMPISVNGITGPQRILVQLLAGDQSVIRGTTIYFLDNVPALEFEEPRADSRVAYGSQFTINLKSDPVLFRAIEGVEIGVDRNLNGEWEDDETLTPVEPIVIKTLSFGNQNSAVADFDSKQLLPKTKDQPADSGKPAAAAKDGVPITLMARGTLRPASPDFPKAEKPKQPANIVRRRFMLVDPSQVAPLTGDIAGTVETADGVPQREVVVSLGTQTTSTDRNGIFQFREIPVGKQVLTAMTPRREGTAETEVQAKKTAQVKILLRLR